ncbi:AAA family ATPase [Streptomyces sp. URMC 129]|uniref:AAA family ATPase n=1 Tax=Streptomyces sp. URMC 129 TaxID=3423407 RepID=UPI003F1BA626
MSAKNDDRAARERAIPGARRVRRPVHEPSRLPGREPDAALLAGMWRGQAERGVPGLIVICGQAGVGKTALARAWLGDADAAFPDGRFVVRLGERPGAPDVLGLLLRAVGASVPDAPEERAAHWRIVTAHRRLALLLDDAAHEDQVRPLLPAAPGCLAVVTSRAMLSGLAEQEAAFLRLTPLPDRAVAAVLRERLGPERVRRDPAGWQRLVTACRGLPLVTALAAGALAGRPHHSAAALAEVLRPGPCGAEHTLARAVDASYRALAEGAPHAADVYRRLGDLPPGIAFDRLDVAAACGLDAKTAGGAVALLAGHALLEEAGEGLFTLRDAVREHAAWTSLGLDASSLRRATLRRYLDWQVRVAARADALLTPDHARRLPDDHRFVPPRDIPFHDGDAAMAWLVPRFGTLVAGIRVAAEAGLDTVVWQLAVRLWPMWLRLRPCEAWIESHELALDAAIRSGDLAARLTVQHALGVGQYEAGRLTESLQTFVVAAELAERTGDQRMLANALHEIGRAHGARGGYRDAVTPLHGARFIRGRTGDRRGAALSQVELARVLGALGDTRRAVGLLHEARDQLAAEADPLGAARATALLGEATARADDACTGIGLLVRAGEEFAALGERHSHARCLLKAGLAAHARHDTARARAFLDRARSASPDLADPDLHRLDSALADPPH